MRGERGFEVYHTVLLHHGTDGIELGDHTRNGSLDGTEGQLMRKA